MVRIGDLIEVIKEDIDHPCKVGDKLTVQELLGYGCVWAKTSEKEWVCLMPTEFEKVEAKKKTKKKGTKK